MLSYWLRLALDGKNLRLIDFGGHHVYIKESEVYILKVNEGAERVGIQFFQRSLGVLCVREIIQ
jgi:hypothetical protein